MSTAAVLDIRIEDNMWDEISGLNESLQRAADAALEAAGFKEQYAAISVLLTGNDEIARINADWRAKERPTNILSFPAPPGSVDEEGKFYLGDVVVAYGVVAREAEDQVKTFETHFCHLIVHGCLHLLGYDHESDDEADIMEGLEIKALARLGIANPYENSNLERTH